MKHKQKLLQMRITVFLTSALLLVMGGCKEKNPLTLKQVMAGLEKEVMVLNSALYIQDYATVEARARAIAEHPRPMKDQRKKIIEHLGERASRFQNHDIEVHSTAEKLAEAAMVKRPDEVMELTLRLQRGCMNCHIEFQREISDLLRDPAAPVTGEPMNPEGTDHGVAPVDGETTKE